MQRASGSSEALERKAMQRRPSPALRVKANAGTGVSEHRLSCRGRTSANALSELLVYMLGLGGVSVVHMRALQEGRASLCVCVAGGNNDHKNDRTVKTDSRGGAPMTRPTPLIRDIESLKTTF